MFVLRSQKDLGRTRCQWFVANKSLCVRAKVADLEHEQDSLGEQAAWHCEWRGKLIRLLMCRVFLRSAAEFWSCKLS